METLNSSVKEKFSGLLFFLSRSKTEFEMVADEMEDYSLRTALNALSDESSYYAGEIKNYLKTFGIYSPAKTNSESYDFAVYPVENTEKGNELQNICSYNEESLTNAYKDLLEESLPFQILKDIMNCQLNALKYTFLKIKTLNSARFNSYQLQ